MQGKFDTRLAVFFSFAYLDQIFDRKERVLASILAGIEKRSSPNGRLSFELPLRGLRICPLGPTPLCATNNEAMKSREKLSWVLEENGIRVDIVKSWYRERQILAH